MEERKNVDVNSWYRPYEADQCPAEGTDLFEEAGIYPLVRPQEPPKSSKWKWVLVGVLCGILLISAIGLTAYIFSDGDNVSYDPKEFFEQYRAFDNRGEKSEVTEDKEIERAELNPSLKLRLKSHDNLTALSLQKLYEKCTPSVVGISTEKNGKALGWGTGVIMTADGYVITNAHVLSEADRVDVILHNGKSYNALLVGEDAISDIAVLKVDAKGLTPAQFGDSALVRVGDDAIAIGNPLGEEFSGTMTTGIISGVSRGMRYQNRTMTLLQTNAALNNGNSGGALFNVYGQVVGITNMKLRGTYTASIEGIGFAIPTATVKQMVDSILEHGAVVGRPGIGVTVYYLNGGTGEYPNGLLVNSVSADSDAEKQGLKPNDIIVEVDGESVTSFDVLRDAIEAKDVGDTITIKVWRAGETITMKIELIDQNDF